MAIIKNSELGAVYPRANKKWKKVPHGSWKQLQAEAKAQGLERFSTGLSCRRGHMADRYVKGGHCVECQKIMYAKQRGTNKHKNGTMITTLGNGEETSILHENTVSARAMRPRGASTEYLMIRAPSTVKVAA